MENIWLIASDMDGTLLKDGWSISKENISAIRHAQNKGIQFIVATGRDYFEASGPLKQAGLSLPAVCVNGADVRGINGEILHRQGIDSNLLKPVRKALENEGMYYEVYTSDGAFTNNREDGLKLVVDLLMSSGEFSSHADAAKLAEMRFDNGSIRMVKSYDELTGTGGPDILKLLAFSKDETSRERVKEQLAFLDVAVSASAKDNIEITHRNATKGNGVKFFAASLGIEPDQIMAIGDNLNDLSMFDAAGLGVAMGNASEAVKKVSDIETLTNDKHGVAHMINLTLAQKTDV
ncbi:Cof-type HAD-IIB family hydrolase [Salisediminibacterium beveridgei]|uniref:Promiscuous sugar phosphatase YidA, haloacid dehalogenase-like phosphatase family n=1 Tax=Salisediminibacterium beveridgei TaxID=632773 RepID=A0A1D7QUP2_9BACI|nr:Cof-type HAD-IIB family hydrolase [Salisediminibacterium beveridgei]AOM82731.1 Promiscuous sugar phosphatase YidA, haloacid dehalogenase-like phosphatase family [Salisediminibacterium beveridgei]